MGGNNDFFENFERNKYLKKNYPACKELNLFSMQDGDQALWNPLPRSERAAASEERGWSNQHPRLAHEDETKKSQNYRE